MKNILNITNLLNITINDFKLIFRDQSLRIFLALPLLIFFMINIFLPYLVKEFPEISEYIPYIVIVATIEVSQMFGFIYSFVFIDEKETKVSKVYGVAPVSKFWFTVLRLVIPLLITVILTWIMLIIQPFYKFPLHYYLGFSFLASLAAPFIALAVSILSKNKMEGLVWSKVLSFVTIIPVIAFFVPQSAAHFFGLFPIHWVFQGLFNLINQEPVNLFLTIGLVYFTLINGILILIFTKRHFI